jgi:hypothetical protein
MTSNALSGMLGTIHGDLRWIFAVVAVLGITRTLYGLIRVDKFSPLDSRMALVFSILLDLQALYGLGLILYLGLSKLGSFQATIDWIDWHPVWMLAAVFVSHLGSRWKEAPHRKRFQVQLGIYGATLVLIVVGVWTSPLQGWV